jgi:hypothetical protein
VLLSACNELGLGDIKLRSLVIYTKVAVDESATSQIMAISNTHASCKNVRPRVYCVSFVALMMGKYLDRLETIG